MNTACLAPNGMSVYRGEGPASRLLVGTAKGVAVLERAPGQEWRLTGTGLDGKHISSLLIEPVNGGVYAGVHRGGVFFSPDQGRTWEPRSTGITIEHVYSLVCAVENGMPVVYAGTEPPSLFRSADEGRTWEELPGWRDMTGQDKWVFPMPPKIPHAKSLAVDPRDPHVLYVGVEQAGLFKTIDGGRTWFELDSYSKPDDESYRDIHQCVLRPNHPDEVFMTTGMGLYRSNDRRRHLDASDAAPRFSHRLSGHADLLAARRPHDVHVRRVQQSRHVDRAPHRERDGDGESRSRRDVGARIERHARSDDREPRSDVACIHRPAASACSPARPTATSTRATTAPIAGG